MKKLLSLFLLTITLAASPLLAQEQNLKMPINVGIYGAANVNLHSPHFLFPWQDMNSPGSLVWISDVSSNQTALGGAFGAIGNFPITDIVTFSLRAGYNMLGADFSQREITQNTFGEEVTVITDLDYSLDFLELTPAIQLHNLLPVKPLYFLVGLEIGLPLRYELTGQLSSEPEGNFFSDEQTVTLTKPETRLAIAGGVGYVIPLAENIFLTPEASFRFPFNSFYKEGDIELQDGSVYRETWKASQIRAGVNLTFGVFNDKPVEIVEAPPKESSIRVNFSDVRSYDDNGARTKVSKIRVEEVQYTELFPLLPYVFYEPGSAKPDPDEQRMASNEAGEFSVESLEPDAYQINRTTLDIIGKRMQENPSATITITGTNDTKSQFETPKVALGRAEEAKNYLVNTYKISDNRITVKSTNLPAKASSINDAEGVQENRRIEFTSNNPAILAPILIQRDKQTISNPKMIEFVPQVTSTDPVDVWQLEVSQGGKTLRRFAGEREVEPVQWMVLPNELAHREIPVEYTFTATNSAGKRDSKSGTVPVEYISSTFSRNETAQPDKIVSKYSLNLFDFNNANVSDSDKEVLRKYVAPAIKYNSTVQIYGYTDRIGEEAYNKKLAQQRADNVKNILSGMAKGAKYETRGLGEDVKIFDNNSPVGRHLSRTVQIYITTPKE